MSATAPTSQLPTDPLGSHTRDRMKELAQEKAAGWLEAKARREIKGWLPSFLHPLIPGEGGTVGGKIKAEISKRFWAWVGGLIFSLCLFAAMGAVVLGTALVVVWAIVMG